MIWLNHINIAFKKMVIQNGNLAIPDQKITVITGPSGSGKTTLLYSLGLISSNKDYTYLFDEQAVDVSRDSVKAQVRKTQIGYVFQDNNLIDTLTVSENIRLVASLTAKPYSEDSVLTLLQTVGMLEKANAYPQSLSGGERQRLAVICALAKDPRLIIADEPTSALDQENSGLIMKLFQEIAYKQGKMVVLASHAPDICQQADVVYEIKQRQITVIKGAELLRKTPKQTNSHPQHVRLGLSFYLSYIRHSSKKLRLRKMLMTVICAAAISFSSLCGDFGQNVIDSQTKLMNQISNREIFVINATSPFHQPGEYFSLPEDLRFHDADYEWLGKITGVEKMVPYFEFHSAYPVDSEKTPGERTIIRKDTGGNDRIKKFNVSGENPASYTIIPYLDAQLMDLKSSEYNEDVENGLYLSASLADYLGIEAPSVLLTADACVPVKLTKSSCEYNGMEYPTNSVIGKKECLEGRVRGILESQIENIYSKTGDYVIYAPYEQLEALLNSHRNTELMPNETAWGPNACIIMASSYQNVQAVAEKAQRVNEHVLVYSQYQDVETMAASIQNTRNIIFIVSIVILVIIFLLMAIVKMNQTEGRRFEISILKANGLSRRETRRIFYLESLFQAVQTIVISCLFAFILSILINSILFHQDLIQLGFPLFAIISFVSLGSIVLPTAITLFFVNCYEPDRIMRGK